MYLITALSMLVTGWCWGHWTARVRVVVVGATAAQDETALSAADEQLLGEWSAHLDQLTAPFDLPDDPRNAT